MVVDGGGWGWKGEMGGGGGLGGGRKRRRKMNRAASIGQGLKEGVRLGKEEEGWGERGGNPTPQALRNKPKTKICEKKKRKRRKREKKEEEEGGREVKEAGRWEAGWRRDKP